MKKKIILTGGKFNKIHPGHVWLLNKAKRLGKLIVVLAHDVTNDRTYAAPASVRKRNLARLGIADKIVIGTKDNFSAVIKEFKPDIIVLGYDQQLPDGTAELVWNMKIKIVKLKRHKSYSTRKMHED
jgi:cytidyltransferase-like protein